MNPPEHQDPAWDLLKHASTSEPSPYFSRRVLREVREIAESGSQNWFSQFVESLSPRVVIPSLVAVSAVVLMIVFQNAEAPSTQPAVSPSVVLQIGDDSVDPATEMEAVEYLGQLMAVADPGQLSDDALADLFF